MLNNKRFGWGHLAIAVTILGGLGTLGGYYAGWKANIEKATLEHAAIQKVIAEHDPLVQRVATEAAMNVTQQHDISTLQGAVASLVESNRELSKEMHEFVQTVLQERYRRGPSR